MPDSHPVDRVPARTDLEAKARFLRFLSLSLSTISDRAIWLIRPLDDGVHAAFTVPDILELRPVDGAPLFLRSTIQFRYGDDERPDRRGERKVFTLDYAHTLGESETLKPQLYSWEWSASGSYYPHVHVRRGHPDFPGLGKVHVPTGRVFFEHVVLFLLHECDVKPARHDWESVLQETMGRVATWASWGGGQPPQNA